MEGVTELLDIKLPQVPDAITADWLQRVLETQAPGLVVNSIRIEDVIRGASTKVRIALDTNRPDIPQRLILKAGFEAHSQAMRHMHENEMHAYRDVIPADGLELDTPRCFFAGSDSDGECFVVLEDLCLREARFLSLQDPIGFDLAATFLDGLARLHARWWGAEELMAGDFSWLPDTSEERFFLYFSILTDTKKLGEFLKLPRCTAMPAALKDPDRILSAHRAMRMAHMGQPSVISHGDMHLGNLYVSREGRPGFLDWQPRRAPWSLDVTYFLIAGLDLLDRRRWQGALLQHYLSQLAAHGIDAPSFDDAWLSFRRDVVWGHLIWMLNGNNFQTEANNSAAAARFSAAMIDLGCFEALGI